VGSALYEDCLLAALGQQGGGRVRHAEMVTSSIMNYNCSTVVSHPSACQGSMVPEENTMFVPAMCTSPNFWLTQSTCSGKEVKGWLFSSSTQVMPGGLTSSHRRQRSRWPC
jgi:hypothetical protein